MTAPLIIGSIILAVLSLSGAAMAFRRGANGSAVLSLFIPLYGAFYLLRTAQEG
jgi:hypothetical protein